MPGRNHNDSLFRFGFNGQDRDNEIYGIGDINTARYWEYDTRLGRRWNIDPEPTTWESLYAVNRDNPLLHDDPDGDCPNCIAAGIGGIVGGLIGGGIEAGIQLYTDGKISNWKAVGGAAVQGGITGAAAGFTGGASLLATAAAAGGANAVGGAISNKIQGKPVTVKSVAKDVVIGTAAGVAGYAVNKFVTNIANSQAVNKAFGPIASKLGLTDEFIQSATSDSKNGLSEVGRALQKHAGRDGSSFSDIKFSGKNANEDGLKIVKDILNSKDKNVEKLENGTTDIFDKVTGRGVEVSRSGKFNGFRDLKHPTK